MNIETILKRFGNISSIFNENGSLTKFGNECYNNLIETLADLGKLGILEENVVNKATDELDTLVSTNAIYKLSFYAGYHEWCLALNENDVYSFGDLAEDMYNENLPFDENLDIVIESLVDIMLECAKEDDSNLTRTQRILILKMTNENLKEIKEQMKIKLTSYYKMEE